MITDEHYRKAADRIYSSEGEIEIDDDAKVSRGDDPGAYVQAWVWVYDSDVMGHEIPEDTPHCECPSCGAIEGPECEGAACHTCGGRGVMELVTTEEEDDGSA